MSTSPVPGNGAGALVSAFRIERYFVTTYFVALDATLGLCLVAILLALLNNNTSPVGSLIVAVTAAGGTRVARTPGSYLFLRRHSWVLAFSGVSAAGCMLAPAMDANALYYPALAPLAIVPCVAARRQEIALVIGAIACGTFIAALADTRYPALARPSELTSSTFAVVIIGVLLAALIDWCAVSAGQPAVTAEDQGSRARGQDAPLTAISEHSALVVDDSPPGARQPRFLNPPAILRAVRDGFRAIRPDLILRSGLSLTARQLEVFYLMLADLDATRSAEWLGISVRSVRRHAAEGRRRAGLSNVEILERLPSIEDYR